MAPRPIFCMTHPRACSTAFERVFMTRRDSLQCVHEPFGDAYYFGPERMSERYNDDNAEAREASGLADVTYREVWEHILNEADREGKRIFIKDMAYYFMAPDGNSTKIAPSLGGQGEEANPTTMPLDLLKTFHFTFLIRHPRRAIPSYFRCTMPPLSEKTGWDHVMSSEAGYEELHRLFDYLIEEGIVDKDRLTVLDADDMLDNPEGAIRAFCEKTDIDYHPRMLKWSDDDRDYAADYFAKWNGWHDDALNNTELKARTHAQKVSTPETENAEWAKKFGEERAKEIRQIVDANVSHYEYLKQFSMKF